MPAEMNTPDLASQDDAHPVELAHVERAKALQRFNRIFVYLPVGTAAAIVLGLVIWFIVIGPAGANESAQATLSGAADIFMIMSSTVLMLLCAIFPLLFFGLTLQLRRSGSRPLFRMQRLFWRANDLVSRLSTAVAQAAPKAASVLIAFRTRLTYLVAVAEQIPNLFKRS